MKLLKRCRHFFEDKARTLAQIVERMKQEAAMAQQKGEQAPPMDPKVAADINNDRLKTVEKLRRTEEQSQFTRQLKQQAFQEDQRRKEMELQERLRRENEKSQQKNSQNAASAAISIAKQTA